MIKLRNLMEIPLSGQDALTISDMKDELDDLIIERNKLADRVTELTNALSKSTDQLEKTNEALAQSKNLFKISADMLFAPFFACSIDLFWPSCPTISFKRSIEPAKKIIKNHIVQRF